ncbi:hypothetical protein G7Z17_g462 [Cylindrodendrum hubeiense]|uniref:Uncharacterized protein n=1 Tax=Cylindrodendrum hubeiense TaxID=595255 RepID=A0A9P5HMW4_9HYPO|nr:hypothetical protein G7Z17_g462 [Cylindrodendrum hubeiense]
MGVLLQSANGQKALRITVIISCLFGLVYFLAKSEVSPRISLNTPWEVAEAAGFTTGSTNKTSTKPEGVVVSGLIFYGRKSRVSSLRCYLERNMVDNGGWLDEILWIVNTSEQEDLRYLDEIIASNPMRHKKVNPEKHLSTYSFFMAWRHLERGKYYVKIDDDILWIDDDAIPNLVQQKIDRPNDLVVSGNIINNPPLGFMHYRMGALHPYFPEPNEPSYVTNGTEYWKPSHHGYWDGPNDFTWDLEAEPPKYQNHRWLRVRDDNMIYQTPVARLVYEVWGDSYKKWAIGAQMHYSLLENIEQDTLDLYKFEKPWTMYEDRIRINFMCVNGDDIVDTDPSNWPEGQGDEDMLVLKLPHDLRRPVTIAGNALAAHFQYSDQNGLGETDLLKRYRALAQDRYCLSSTARR